MGNDDQLIDGRSKYAWLCPALFSVVAAFNILDPLVHGEESIKLWFGISLLPLIASLWANFIRRVSFPRLEVAAALVAGALLLVGLYRTDDWSYWMFAVSVPIVGWVLAWRY